MRAKGCPPGVTGRRCTKRGRDPDQRSAEALGGRTSTCRSSTWSAASLVLQCLVRFRSTSHGQGCGAAPVHPVTAPCRRNAPCCAFWAPSLPASPAALPGPTSRPPSSLASSEQSPGTPSPAPPARSASTTCHWDFSGEEGCSAGGGVPCQPWGRWAAGSCTGSCGAEIASRSAPLVARGQPSALPLDRTVGVDAKPSSVQRGVLVKVTAGRVEHLGAGAHGWSAAARSPRLGRRPWSEPLVRPRPSRVDMRPEGDARHSQRHAAKSRSFAGRHGLSPPPLSGLSSLSSDET